MVTFLATLVTSYVVFYYLIEKYIYSRIKLIYKLIYQTKATKKGGKVKSSKEPALVGEE